MGGEQVEAIQSSSRTTCSFLWSLHINALAILQPFLVPLFPRRREVEMTLNEFVSYVCGRKSAANNSCLVEFRILCTYVQHYLHYCTYMWVQIVTCTPIQDENNTHTPPLQIQENLMDLSLFWVTQEKTTHFRRLLVIRLVPPPPKRQHVNKKHHRVDYKQYGGTFSLSIMRQQMWYHCGKRTYIPRNSQIYLTRPSRGLSHG